VEQLHRRRRRKRAPVVGADRLAGEKAQGRAEQLAAASSNRREILVAPTQVIPEKIVELANGRIARDRVAQRRL
jgi:hypothetical protein